MRRNRVLSLAVGLSLIGVWGCSDDDSGQDIGHDDAATDVDGVDEGPDGVEETGETVGDGGDTDVTGEDGTEDSFDGYCTDDEQCWDEQFCNGQEKCVDHECVPGLEPCADVLDCTVDSCDEDLDRCNHVPDNSVCQNEFPCDGEEQCLPGIGCSDGTRPDCRDDSACTIDRCDDARGGCVHDPRDLDGDTFMTSDYDCPGDDCNDSDDAINPDAEEICDDIRDNDCDTTADFADISCRPENDVCAGATILAEGVRANSSTRGTMHDYSLSCNSFSTYPDVVFQITLPDVRDLIVTINSTFGGSLYAEIQRTCGIASSTVRCSSGSALTLRQNGLPAGTYYVIVESYTDADFNITYTTSGPTLPPANNVCSGAVDVPAAGGVISGTLVDTTHDYASTCGASYTYPDVYYRLTLTEAKKVTITASLTPTSYYTYLALMTECGRSTTELACATGYTSTITRNFLAAGVYYIAVDGSPESPFTLTVRLEDPILPPANDRCDGATDISGGGIFVGTMLESYRDYPPSCSTASLSDVVYQFTLTETQDVRIEASPVGAATNYVVALRTDCPTASSETACRSGNPAVVNRRSLEAGTYYIMVSGPTAAPGNRFLLQVTMSEPTPVPGNDVCSGAVDISAGGTFTGSTASCSDDYDPTCGGLGYFDTVYNLTLTEAHNVNLVLTPTTGTAYLDLRRGTCGTGSTSARCGSGATATVFLRGLEAGSYWVLVDTASETNYTLTVEITAPTSPCDSAELINVDYTGGATFSFSDSGTLIGRPADFTSTCGGSAGGPDYPYRLVLPVRSTVTAQVTASSGFDTVLHLRSTCDGTSLYCNDDGSSSCSLCSLLSAMTLEAGTYYLIMDTYGSGGTGGTYTLQVTATEL